MNIIFAGTPEFALPSLQCLLTSRHQVLAVYTQPDRPKGRGCRLLMSPVKQFAFEKNIPVSQPLTLLDLNEQKKLADLQADIMVVVAYGLILPRSALAIPRLGCINVHASLLPRWRGAAPIQRAILAGDTETGISIMQMNEGLDTGQVLNEVSCPIYETDTSQTLQDRLAQLGAKSLLSSLNDIQQGNYQLQSQDNNKSTYAKKIDKAEAVINWRQSAKFIDRMIRAFNPKPVAYTFLNKPLSSQSLGSSQMLQNCETIDNKVQNLSAKSILRIWSAQILEQTANNIPGTILNVTPLGIDVMTGSGILRLMQLQLPGGRCLPVSDLLNSKSHLFNVGMILG